MKDEDINRIFDAYDRFEGLLESNIDNWTLTQGHGRAAIEFQLTDGRQARIRFDLYPLDE